MKNLKLFTITVLLISASFVTANAQYYQNWVVRHDGPEILGISSNDYVTDMVVRDSYVYVTGYEDSFGSNDWATVKYDYAGQELWVRKYEEGIGQAEAMAVDAAGNVYVTGYSSENYVIDVLTFKYSPDGDLLWEVRYNNPAGNQDKPKDMAFDASGNIYIAGSSDDDAQEDVDLLLLKYDSEGVLLWDRTLDNGDGQTDAGYVLAIDPDGNAIVAGWTEPNPYLVKYSPTGDLLWEDEHVGYSTHDWWQEIETDAEGNIYVLGEISPGSQSKHIWTAKYDPDGNILWEDNYTGTHSYACYEGGLALMPDGGVVICGQSWDEPSNISIVTIRYAPDGTKLWQRLEKAGYSETSGDDVAVDADGNIYVTGYGYNYSYSEDIITLGYSPDGDLLWTQIYIGPDYPDQSDYPHAIAVDEALNVFVAAHSWGDNSNDFTTIMYSPIPDVTVTLTYNSGSPVPAGGGYINFDVTLQNNGTTPQNFDLWIEIPPQITPPSVPNRNLTFPGGHILFRPGMNWPIAAGWPAGNYEMIWNIGNLSTLTVWAQDSFSFEKSTVANGSGFALRESDGDPLDQLFDQTDLGETASVSEFALMGNYPNPFNPTTTIQYGIPNAAKVSLSVYDLQGRRVADLVNGQREAGVHEVTFDASSLASGVYIYRLSADNFNAIGKMMLVK